MATNKETVEASLVFSNILVLGFIFSYLLMLGFGNFEAGKAFEDFIPFGLFLALYKASTKNA